MRSLPHLLLLALALCLASCFDDEDYSTSATDFLVSDADTVRFDTVISGEPTSTATFRLFNPAKKYVRLAEAYLEGGASSPFHVNIDGAVLGDGTAQAVEVAGRDSLSVFLMANLPDLDQDEPQFVRDRLVLVTEGGARTVIVLEASGQSVVKMRAERISTDTRLDAARPYQVVDSLVVDAGATLTLPAGTRLWMHPGTTLVVHGTLVAEGTAEHPVTLRGDRLGNMFNAQPYDRIPAQWGGVVFASESTGNTLQHTDIHSATFGLRVLPGSDTATERLRLENSVVHNVSDLCLEAEGSRIFVGNTQITNGGAGCVSLRGGDATFVHCTIGRFYAFAGGYGSALTFTNADAEGRALPLVRADFLNTIVTGYSTDEVMAERAYADEEAVFNFRFDHCLLDTDPVDDETVAAACLWDNTKAAVWREDNFTPAFDYATLTFTFGLAAESQAVGTADPSVTAAYYPLDRLGAPRPAAAPDMGCYQHAASE
ncbi:MAG: hypothetical protein J6M53_02555 [Bacteroidaceae bacterium]|nr:hypothetical protein [Bacteroidaceae bacterium]